MTPVMLALEPLFSIHTLKTTIKIMAVLRSGKIIKAKKQTKINRQHRKYKLKDFSINLYRLNSDEIQKYLHPPAKKYFLRSKKTEPKENIANTSCNKNIGKEKKQVATISAVNVIWKELTNQSNDLQRNYIVLAKMGNFRPWPARINSIYVVGNVIKCYVLFYGTLQIGSVLKSQCVRVSECDSFLLHTIKDIKRKYNWDLDYETLAKTDDLERTIAIQKLTLVQKFLLAVRDIENLQQIPYELSMLQLVSV